jgi:hypothetical protein
MSRTSWPPFSASSPATALLDPSARELILQLASEGAVRGEEAAERVKEILFEQILS